MCIYVFVFVCVLLCSCVVACGSVSVDLWIWRSEFHGCRVSGFMALGLRFQVFRVSEF